MKPLQEEALVEALRMIEAHLERIANALEQVIPPPAPGEPTLNPPRGRLETLAEKQKETYDNPYRKSNHLPASFFDR